MSRGSGTSQRYARSLAMPHYFFHLAGKLLAHDVLGQDCSNDANAHAHARALAAHLATEKPTLVEAENHIRIVNCQGDEVGCVPIVV
jgi:hypothetical protein